MLGPARVAMLVFDACRNNPYRGVRGGTGLAPMEARGTLVAYAAGAGEVAADSAPGSSNGLFTSKFVEALRAPGLTATALFRRVRRDVYEASNSEQWPAVYDDLLSDFVFRPSASAGVAASVAAPPAATASVEASLGLDRASRRRIQRGLAEAGFDPGPADGVFGPGTRTAIRRWQASRGAPSTGYLDGASASALGAPAVSAASAGAGGPSAAVLQQETAFWQSIEDSTNPADFEAYKRRYPGGAFEDLADNRLAVLRGTAGGTGPPGPSPVPDPALPRPRRPGDVFRDCAECPEMVVLAGGGLAMGRYEVTVGEYRAFVSATGGTGDDRWRDHDNFPQTDRHPVTLVSWNDAQEYVSWLSRRTGATYRLPAEAEWARAASGSQPGCDRLGRRSRPNGTCPVGQNGRNAAGLSDMVGNVWELTSSCWDGDCGRRVVRGGSWSNSAEVLRSGARSWAATAFRSNDLGFRVSRTLD